MSETNKPSAEQLAKFKQRANDMSLSEEARAKFRAIVEKFESAVEDKPAKAPRKPRAPKAEGTTKKAPATKGTGKKSADDIEKAKAEIKRKTGKTEEECESIIEQYRALRAKAQEGKRKAEEASKGNKQRIKKLQDKGDLIEGTNEKTADAVIETSTKDVADKIEKEIEAVEEKAEKDAKAEVAKDKTLKTPQAKKDAIKAKVEEQVKQKTKPMIQRIVIDTSELLTTIATSLGKFDKDSQKEFLIKLRSDIDKLLSKYAFGGMTDGATQVMNIQQSNLSASSVNPTLFANGGGVEKNYNNPEKSTHVLHIDGHNWYLEKIDSTHFYMSNSPNYRGMAHHIGQHKGESYYDEVRQWLKSTYADGGGVGSVSYDAVLDVLKDKLDDAVQEVPSHFENSYNAEGEEVEHVSRDGFIAYTDGGYEVRWFEQLSYFSGSGYSLPTSALDKEKDRQIEYNYTYAKERFMEEYPEIVEELGEENIDYNSLYDADYGDEAEQLSEWENDYDGEGTIMCEIGAYYYSPKNDRGIDGKHTLRLFGLVNLESPYHRSGNLEDRYDIDITFDSIEQLEEKVEEGLKEITEWFDGSKYNESTEELRIRRMAKGGIAEHGLKVGDKIDKKIGQKGEYISVQNPKGNALVNLEKGVRMPYSKGGGVDGKMSYERFVETLRDNDRIDGYTGRTTTGMEMFYLPSGHKYLGKKFTHKNKRKAYQEYLQMGKKIGYSKGGGVGNKLSIAQTRRIANETAKALGSDFKVTRGSVEVASFDLDFKGQYTEGGSYVIHSNGDVVNYGLPNKPVYYNYKTKKKFAKGGGVGSMLRNRRGQ